MIEEQIKKFQGYTQDARNADVELRSPNAHTVHVVPATCKDFNGKVPLTISSLIHGNEVVGLYVVNQLIEDLLAGKIKIRMPITFMTGNFAAAKLNQRFVEKDLNRCFGATQTATLEDQICRAIEPNIRNSKYVIDLHQTIEPTKNRFFIFSFSPTTLGCAYHLDQATPIITSWDHKASADGKILEEYARENGTVALTLELGQKGYDQQQMNTGLKICQRAIEVLVNQNMPDFAADAQKYFSELEVYRLLYYYRKKNKGANLKPGLMNFAPVSSGENLGVDGEVPIIATDDAKIIFPKYGKNAQTASELFGLLKQLQFADLPWSKK